MLRYPRQDMAQNKNINNKKSNISDSEALKVASQILIEISRADQAYHRDDNPEISDREYDELKRELEKFKKSHPPTPIGHPGG